MAEAMVALDWGGGEVEGPWRCDLGEVNKVAEVLEVMEVEDSEDFEYDTEISIVDGSEFYVFGGGSEEATAPNRSPTTTSPLALSSTVLTYSLPIGPSPPTVTLDEELEPGQPVAQAPAPCTSPCPRDEEQSSSISPLPSPANPAVQGAHRR